MKKSVFHNPVMSKEVIEHLSLKNGYKILDATVGLGGHARQVLEKILPGGFLIGVDCDANALKFAKDQLAGFGSKTHTLLHGNFRNIDEILSGLSIGAIDGAVFDLGVSSYQLNDASRGFGFGEDGPLDMRMDPSRGRSAYDIVNRLRKDELEDIIRGFGQERYFRRIAGSIIARRANGPIESSGELSALIGRAVGSRYRSQRIHPATRTFQAIRIAVNEELINLEEGLAKVVDLVRPRGRICVISFHSLEDRIVKFKFRELAKSGIGRVVTKKPVTPKDDEKRENPRARSAKMRAFEKI